MRDLDREPFGSQPGGDGGRDDLFVLDHTDKWPVH
jgi:hypothetical protein